MYPGVQEEQAAAVAAKAVETEYPQGYRRSHLPKRPSRLHMLQHYSTEKYWTSAKAKR